MREEPRGGAERGGWLWTFSRLWPRERDLFPGLPWLRVTLLPATGLQALEAAQGFTVHVSRQLGLPCTACPACAAFVWCQAHPCRLPLPLVPACPCLLLPVLLVLAAGRPRPRLLRRPRPSTPPTTSSSVLPPSAPQLCGLHPAARWHCGEPRQHHCRSAECARAGEPARLPASRHAGRAAMQERAGARADGLLPRGCGPGLPACPPPQTWRPHTATAASSSSHRQERCLALLSSALCGSATRASCARRSRPPPPPPSPNPHASQI